MAGLHFRALAHESSVPHSTHALHGLRTRLLTPPHCQPTEVQHPAAVPAGSRPSSVPPLNIQNRKATKKKTVQVQGVNAADMLEYQGLFADFDVDGSGSIDSKELRYVDSYPDV